MFLKELDFTLCNSVMNRDDDLERAIPTWLVLPFRHCIILDWSSHNDVWETHKHLMDERFTVIRVDGETKYESSIVHNFCIGFVNTEWVFRIDSDIMTMPQLSDMKILPSSFYTGNVKYNWGLAGTCLFRKEWFDITGGYDENMTGYGYEDIMFYRRMQENLGARRQYFPNVLIHQDHNDEKRGKYRGLSDKEVHTSKYKNGRFKHTDWGINNTKYKPKKYTVYGRKLV